MEHPYRITPLNGVPFRRLAFQNALGVTTLKSSFLGVEMADQVFPVVSPVVSFPLRVAERPDCLIACRPKVRESRSTILGALKSLRGEDGNGYFPLALWIDGVVVAPGLMSMSICSGVAADIPVAHSPCVELVVEAGLGTMSPGFRLP